MICLIVCRSALFDGLFEGFYMHLGFTFDAFWDGVGNFEMIKTRNGQHWESDAPLAFCMVFCYPLIWGSSACQARVLH